MALILHPDADIVARRQVELADVVSGIEPVDRDLDPAAFGHGVACVEDEVHQRQLELRLVDVEILHLTRAAPVDADCPAERVLDQPGDRLAQGIRIDAGRGQVLLAGESHHPPDQLGALFGGMAHLGDDQLFAFLERKAALEQVKPAEHRGQEIVEIVRDPPSELADRIHFLRLNQPAFERALFGHVGQRAGEFGGSVIGILHQHGLIEEMLVAAIGAFPAIFDRESAGRLALAKRQPAPGRDRPDAAAAPTETGRPVPDRG